MIRIGCWLVVATALQVAWCGEVYVSPSGDDAAKGTREAPVRTLKRAQTLARAQGAGTTVWLRGGEYPMRETLVLTAVDSGTTWRAYGDERPVLTGAYRLSGGVPVSDPVMKARFPASVRERVREFDVRVSGYDGFEPYEPCGLWYSVAKGYKTVRRANTLYANGRRLTIARTPNEGFLRIGEVLNGGAFIFKASTPEMPLLGKKDAPDLVTCGYYQYFWDDENVRAEVTDPAQGIVKLEWLAGHHVMPGHTFFFQNAPALLDAPGEWYLDRVTGRLYLLPPDETTNEYVLSGLAREFVRIENAKDIRIEGLVFEYGRSDAVVIAGASNIAFEGNLVRNFGGIGLLADGSRLRIAGNLLHSFGHDALRVTGGDRRTLTGSGNVIEGNDISETGFVQRCYTPGIWLEGCGTQLALNHFHNLPSSAMRVEGNDHDIVSNLVENVVKESDDQGGCDMFGNPTYAGCVYRYNVWRDIVPKGGVVACGRAGVRFDDAISNQKVYGNRFHNCSVGWFGGVQIHGGRGNLVSNNLFTACHYGVSVAPWSLPQWQGFCRQQRPDGITWDNPAYVARYPGFAHLPDMPMTNIVCCNVMVGVAAAISTHGNDQRTVAWSNLVSADFPSEAEWRKLPGFTMPPKPEEVGPRPNEPFLARARRNDNL